MQKETGLLQHSALYAITDISSEDTSILTKIEQVCRGGADIIQLRSKTLLDGALYRLGLKIRKISTKHNKLFIVNDRPDIALLVGADGVHLGQNDLPIDVVRAFFIRRRQKKIIGVSTHSIKQALLAERAGADYIGVGPVFKTPTKKTYVPVGLELIRNVAKKISIPFVAIGGINTTNAHSVKQAGAQCIAVVRALFYATDPKKAACALRLTMSDNEKDI